MGLQRGMASDGHPSQGHQLPMREGKCEPVAKSQEQENIADCTASPRTRTLRWAWHNMLFTILH